MTKKINGELEELVCNSIIKIANKKRNLQKFLNSKNKLKRIKRSINNYIKFNKSYKKDILKKIHK